MKESMFSNNFNYSTTSSFNKEKIRWTNTNIYLENGNKFDLEYIPPLSYLNNKDNKYVSNNSEDSKDNKELLSNLNEMISCNAELFNNNQTVSKLKESLVDRSKKKNDSFNLAISELLGIKNLLKERCNSNNKNIELFNNKDKESFFNNDKYLIFESVKGYNFSIKGGELNKKFDKAIMNSLNKDNEEREIKDKERVKISSYDHSIQSSSVNNNETNLSYYNISDFSDLNKISHNDFNNKPIYNNTKNNNNAEIRNNIPCFNTNDCIRNYNDLDLNNIYNGNDNNMRNNKKDIVDINEIFNNNNDHININNFNYDVNNNGEQNDDDFSLFRSSNINDINRAEFIKKFSNTNPNIEEKSKIDSNKKNTCININNYDTNDLSGYLDINRLEDNNIRPKDTNNNNNNKFNSNDINFFDSIVDKGISNNNAKLENQDHNKVNINNYDDIIKQNSHSNRHNNTDSMNKKEEIIAKFKSQTTHIKLSEKDIEDFVRLAKNNLEDAFKIFITCNYNSCDIIDLVFEFKNKSIKVTLNLFDQTEFLKLKVYEIFPDIEKEFNLRSKSSKAIIDCERIKFIGLLGLSQESVLIVEEIK